jgi:hypothetical protein
MEFMKSPRKRPEFFAVSTPAQPMKRPLERLREWLSELKVDVRGSEFLSTGLWV